MKIVKVFFLFILLLATQNSNASTEIDGYEKMATDFSKSSKVGEKVAVIPFIFLDDKKDAEKIGSIISERLISKIVKLKVLKVVDKQYIEKTLGEQKVDVSGVVDSNTTKSLGKILGVDGIISGSLISISTHEFEVNAKLINTETTEIEMTSDCIIEKDWSEKVPNYISQNANSENRDRETKRYLIENTNTDNFFDVMVMTNYKSSMKMEFNNSTKMSEMSKGLDLNNDGKLSESSNINHLNINSMKLKSFTPGMGFRVLSFKEHIGIGFDFISYENFAPQQNVSALYNSEDKSKVELSDDYIKVKSYVMNMGLYSRFGKKMIQPYVGFNIGVSINNISSSYISYRKPYLNLDSNNFGFSMSIPVGVRVNVTERLSLMAEARSLINTVSFSSTGKSNDTKITSNNNFIVYGMSLII